MVSRRMVGTLVGLGLLMSSSVNGAISQSMPEMFPTAPAQPFRPIEQPLSLKVAVTLGGLALIGLEAWWFLFSKQKAQQAESDRGIQEVTITVDGGYEPSRVIVNVGQPVRLNFFRRDSSSCLEKVLFPDFHIAQDLAIDRVTPVEFTPESPGQYSFTCGMNMFRGVVEVRTVGSPT